MIPSPSNRGIVKIIGRGYILPFVPPKTQPGHAKTEANAANSSPRDIFARWLGKPWILALIVVLVNSLKPVTVDDTAYLAYARHIAVGPFDPYGFTFFWYNVPENAFEILIPPVLPYWLALEIRLLGENPALLKLGMYPFLLLFAWSARELLRRFARGSQEMLLQLIVLSPAILPTVNLMLDVPALGLGLTAIALFIRSCRNSSWHLALASGFIAGLAMQTKYTALLVPPTIALFGLTHRRTPGVRLAALAIAAAILVFSGWELFLAAKYGRSHFLFHVRDQQSSIESGNGSLASYIKDKAYLIAPLTGYLGCLGIGNGLLAAFALGLPRRVIAIVTALWTIGFAWIALTPGHWNILSLPDNRDISLISAFWQFSGALFLLGVAGSSLVLAVRFRGGIKIRSNADALFLAGWLLIELGGYFALTPFGAARRVIGLVVVGGFIAIRAVNRISRIRVKRKPGPSVTAFAITVGAIVAAIDTLDAFPEKYCAERAAAVMATREMKGKAWFAGHWGFQYYAARAGMEQIVPGQTTLEPGDFLILPIHPDGNGFYRPHFGSISIDPPSWAVEEIEEVVWDDPLAAQTVPNFYGGIDPVVGRDFPRLRVHVYRVIREWRVSGKVLP